MRKLSIGRSDEHSSTSEAIMKGLYIFLISK